MCGICGSFAPDGGIGAPEIERTTRALARRGPDGEGFWNSPDGRVRFGHRRLSILDLSSAGAQPMHSFDGRFTIVYNGEIYNFRRLRAELAADGVAFRSDSDTEVIVELWRRHGADALSRLRGMFAFALWDEAAGELVLARDPYGIKPLYYALDGGDVRFASQVKALEAGGGVSLEVDGQGVAGFLAWGSVPEPLTIRRAIRALPAGHLLRVSARGAPFVEPAPYRPQAPPLASLGEALEESVRDHLVADVPIAIFLSAGVDSAAVAALARRAAGGPLTALTLTWAEARGSAVDEEPLARATAAALGLEHRVHEVSGAEVRRELPAILAAMDQPSIDGFNSWLVARFAAESGFKVALSGLGGDELLGGYRTFRDVPRWVNLAPRLGALPGLRSLWPALARSVAPARPKLADLLAEAGSIAGAYALRRGLHSTSELAELASGYDARVDAWERLGETGLGSADRLLFDPWHAVHRLESQHYLRNQLLRDADWAGMAHGIEIRTPFVDARLRAACERLGFEPARRVGKAVALRRLAPELPAALWTRPKSGFQLPIADWLEGASVARRGVGTQSRRLARIVLEAFGVPWPLEGGRRNERRSA